MVAAEPLVEDRECLLLVDGNGLLYRAFYAIPALTTQEGYPSNAVYGFALSLLKVLREWSPEYVAVAFDCGRTFRHEQYEHYKAQRGPKPTELVGQFAPAREFCKVLGIPVLEQPGYEADDVLGTVSAQFEAQGGYVVILTGDADLMQLVSEQTRIIYTGRHFGDPELMDEAAVEGRYGILPAQLIDYKGMVGDASDNLPGVRGVGGGTAAKLLQLYGDMESIYEALDAANGDNLPGLQTRFTNALRKDRDAAFLTRDLGTIRRDVEVEPRWEAMLSYNYRRGDVQAWLSSWDMHSLMGRIPVGLLDDPETKRLEEQATLFLVKKEAESQGEVAGAVPEGYRLVITREEIEALVAELQGVDALAVDVETTGLGALWHDLVGISLSWEKGKACYIPLTHTEGEQAAMEDVQELLGPILADPNVGKVFHNAKFDMHFLRRWGLPVRGLRDDAMLMAKLACLPSAGLKEAVAKELRVEMLEIDSLLKQGRTRITFDKVPMTAALPYAAADADMTLRLSKHLAPRMAQLGCQRLYQEVEVPLVEVLCEMERVGILVDIDRLAEQRRVGLTWQDNLQQEMLERVGRPINLGSTQQLSHYLFEELDLPKTRQIKTGYSTANDQLETIRDAHPFVPLLLHWRQIETLRSTFLESLPHHIHPSDGRVHTSYNQAVVTGRFASSSPNLQNLPGSPLHHPTREDIVLDVRSIFVPKPGWKLVAIDYSQVELRVLAHGSQDTAMLAAFQAGEDIHATTAAAIFDIPLQEVTKEQRALGKTINFGLAYGMGVGGFAHRTGYPFEEAKRYIDRYFQRFAGVRQYMDAVFRDAIRNGYVRTYFGRRRYFARPQDQRNAIINTPIQGTAADIIKIAMVKLDRWFRESGVQLRMLLQIHDEVVFEVPEDELDLVPELCRVMETAAQLRVPLVAEASVGDHWGAV